MIKHKFHKISAFTIAKDCSNSTNCKRLQRHQCVREPISMSKVRNYFNKALLLGDNSTSSVQFTHLSMKHDFSFRSVPLFQVSSAYSYFQNEKEARGQALGAAVTTLFGTLRLHPGVPVSSPNSYF